MKKVLLGLGVIGALIVVFFLAQLAYLGVIVLQEGGTLDAETKSWVDTTIPKIVTNWDAQLLYDNSSRAAKEAVPREGFDTIMKMFSTQFGRMDEYLGSEGEGGISMNNFQAVIGARYVVRAKYGDKIVQINIQGIKEEGVWKIYAFNVDLNATTSPPR